MNEPVGRQPCSVHALGRSKHLCLEEAPVEMLAVRRVLIYVETGWRPEDACADAHNPSLPRNHSLR